MFLNLYLLLLNTMSITFISIYLKNIYLSLDDLKKIKENLNEYKKKKSKVKLTYEEQLEYMKLKTDGEDIENEKLLYWKVCLFGVAIFSALTIVLTEPISIFGVRFRYMTLLLILITGYLFTKLLQKIGVEI